MPVDVSKNPQKFTQFVRAMAQRVAKQQKTAESVGVGGQKRFVLPDRSVRFIIPGPDLVDVLEGEIAPIYA